MFSKKNALDKQQVEAEQQVQGGNTQPHAAPPVYNVRKDYAILTAWCDPLGQSLERVKYRNNGSGKH